jgi:hypothetical protein
MTRRLRFATFISREGEPTMSSEDQKVPKFASEREEAEWWDANPDFALQALRRAQAEGGLGIGSAAARHAAKGAVKDAALNLDAADISLANKLAERKGIDREAYLRELVHAALLKEAEALDRTSAA